MSHALQPRENRYWLIFAALVVLCVLSMCVGCASKTYFVPPGGYAYLAEPVTARVAVPQGKGKPNVVSKAKLPAGWIIMAPVDAPTTLPSGK